MMVEFECVPLLEKVDAAVALVSRGEMLAIDALGAIVFGNSSHLISEDQTRTYHGTCKHGHLLNESTAYFNPNNGRVQCRICARDYKRKHRVHRDRSKDKRCRCSDCGKACHPSTIKGRDPLCHPCWLKRDIERRRAKKRQLLGAK